MQSELTDSRGQFFLGRRQITILIEIADYQLRRLVHFRGRAQSPQLPRQVIGQSRGLGEKVLKRGLFIVLIFRLRPIAGVKIILEIRSEVDLFKRILGRSRGLFSSCLLYTSPSPRD